MELIEPSLRYQHSIEEAVRESEGQVEQGFGLLGQHFLELSSPKTIQDYIQVRADHSEGKNLPMGWVPSTTYWLIDEGIFVGEINIRHQLTEHLRNIGGQIGYWIRPSKREQGLGTIILEMGLGKAVELGISEILITCDETNVGSRKIIEANGGILEKSTDMGPKLQKN
jgi:predicted acetyltransferase